MTSSRIIKTSLALFALAALVGCMKDTDTPSNGPGNFDSKSTKDETAGTFVTESSAPLENGQVPDTLKLPPKADCASLPEDQKWNYRFDPRALVGDTFVDAVVSTSPDRSSSMTSSTTIASISADAMVTSTNLTDIRISPAPNFPIPALLNYKTTCKQVKAGEYPECSVEFTTPLPGGSEMESLWCTADMGDLSKTTGMAERGTFTMKSGSKVLALRVSQTFPVTIKCKRGDQPEQDYGSGLGQWNFISTNDVVSKNPVNCSSSSFVYAYSAFAKDGGQVMSIYKDETISAPVR